MTTTNLEMPKLQSKELSKFAEQISKTDRQLFNPTSKTPKDAIVIRGATWPEAQSKIDVAWPQIARILGYTSITEAPKNKEYYQISDTLANRISLLSEKEHQAIKDEIATLDDALKPIIYKFAFEAAKASILKNKPMTEKEQQSLTATEYTSAHNFAAYAYMGMRRDVIQMAKIILTKNLFSRHESKQFALAHERMQIWLSGQLLVDDFATADGKMVHIVYSPDKGANQ